MTTTEEPTSTNATSAETELDPSPTAVELAREDTPQDPPHDSPNEEKLETVPSQDSEPSSSEEDGSPKEDGDVEPQRITRLERQLEQALHLAEHREELVDRLHSENQRLREGELHMAMLPLLRDLMRLHDDLEQIVENDPASSDAAFTCQALTDTLARNGITKFLPSENEPFDSLCHAAVGMQPTTAKASDRTIHAVRRGGFRRDDGSIVRVADVVVHRYRAPATTLETQECSPQPGDGETPTEQNIDNERN